MKWRKHERFYFGRVHATKLFTFCETCKRLLETNDTCTVNTCSWVFVLSTADVRSAISWFKVACTFVVFSYWSETYGKSFSIRQLSTSSFEITVSSHTSDTICKMLRDFNLQSSEKSNALLQVGSTSVPVLTKSAKEIPDFVLSCPVQFLGGQNADKISSGLLVHTGTVAMQAKNVSKLTRNYFRIKKYLSYTLSVSIYFKGTIYRVAQSLFLCFCLGC